MEKACALGNCCNELEERGNRLGERHKHRRAKTVASNRLYHPRKVREGRERVTGLILKASPKGGFVVGTMIGYYSR